MMYLQGLFHMPRLSGSLAVIFFVAVSGTLLPLQVSMSALFVLLIVGKLYAAKFC